MKARAEMANRPIVSIVDDDESVREATINLMRAAGFSPEAFPCADDFLKSESRGRTDCLIADLHMPGMSGLELHGRLVQSGNAIPTILITAYPDEKIRASAVQAGIVGYLTKPFNANELLDCIHSALNQGNVRSKSS
jgi:FixJ family two-component response regulator